MAVLGGGSASFLSSDAMGAFRLRYAVVDEV